MFFPVSAWLPAFVLTIAVELPVLLVLLSRAERQLVRLTVLVVVANLATHLAVWYLFTQLFLVGTMEYTIAAEIWAIAAETIFYLAAIRGISVTRVVAAVGLANAASFVVGRLATMQPALLP